MKHLILMLSALVAVSAGHAQVAVHEKSPETKYAFTLASPRQTLPENYAETQEFDIPAQEL